MLLGIFGAALCQGLVGFGFGLISIPILAIFLDLKQAIILGIFLAFADYLILLMRSFKLLKQLRFKKIRSVVASIVIGLLSGFCIFVAIDNELLKIITGIIVIVSGFMLLTGYFPNIKDSEKAKIFLGYLSGMLQTMTGMGGPPIIIYYSSQKIDRDGFRSNIITLFLLMSCLSFLMMIFNPATTKTTFQFSLELLPAVVVGNEIGIRIVRFVNDKLFRFIVNILIILSGLTMIF